MALLFSRNSDRFKIFKSLKRYYRDIVYERTSLPLITTPLHVLKKATKFRQRKSEELNRYRRVYGVDPKRDRVIVQCVDKTLNHYSNQKYPPNLPILLGSNFWKNRKYAGETLVINQRAKPNSVFFNEDKIRFDEFDLCDELLRVLKENDFEFATGVQSLAIPKVLASDTNAIVAAETGSGKTIAYLLPLINNLHLHRRKFGLPKTYSPRAVIFAPSRELSTQIYQTLKKLIGYTQLTAVHLSSSDIYPKELEKPTDIVVGTPGRIEKFRKAGLLTFNSLFYVTIDEADTLLDDTFRDLMLDLLGDVTFQVNSNNLPSTKLILVSATFPDHLDEFLSGLADLENFEQITTPNLHIIQAHVVHRFIRLTKPMLNEQILILLKKELKMNRNCLLFVNDIESGTFLMHHLRNNYVPCEFLFRDNRRLIDCKRILNDFQCERTKILISTGLGSRGLDLTNVQHVINFNFPKNLADYVHRAGRLGRIGSKAHGGLVTNFICDAADAVLVQKIETSVRLNEQLRDVSVNFRKEFYEQHKSP